MSEAGEEGGCYGFINYLCCHGFIKFICVVMEIFLMFF